MALPVRKAPCARAQLGVEQRAERVESLRERCSAACRPHKAHLCAEHTAHRSRRTVQMYMGAESGFMSSQCGA